MPSSKTTKGMLPWNILKSTSTTSLTTPPWSGYFSTISSDPTEITNMCALSILPYPVTEWNTINTALKIMCNLKNDALQESHFTTQDLAICEKAVPSLYCKNNAYANHYNLRLGELHVSMAHLRGIGSYIEDSGLDSIWIQADVYGPAVTRSILSCSHYKRCFNAHEVTVAALYHLLFSRFMQKSQRLSKITRMKNRNISNFCLS